jgi:hypothetical protein
VNCTLCHSQDAHNISFFNTTGAYTKTISQAGNCTTCHQNGLSTFNTLKTNSKVTYTGSDPPQIPVKLNHSENSSAGTLWNETTPGYNGPWSVNGAGSNLVACNYCHGDTKHNASALGRVAQALGGNNILNGTINSTSKWCGACHYPGNADYNSMMTAFDDAGLERPPDNTNESGAAFFNHSATLQSDDSDEKCQSCHGNLLSASAKMDEFVHNVGEGGGSPDCASTACHDNGAGPDMNWTSFGLSVHFNLNNNATNTSDLTNPIAKACWACHGDGTEPNGHPVNQTTPWKCPDCHVPGGPNYGTYTDAPDIQAHVPSNVTYYNANLTTNGANAYCTNCHDEDLGNPNGSESGFASQSLLANVSHYTQNDSLRSSTTFINGTGGQAANCTYCHYDDDARAAWGGAPDPRITVNHDPEWDSLQCGSCHYQSLAGSLHDPALTGSPNGGPNCVFCHDNYNTSFYINATKVNVSAMNQTYSLHRSLNNRSADPGDSDTGGWDWNNRRCWACHAAGNSTDSFGGGVGNHPANYNQPFNCTNCHINGSSGNNVYFASSLVLNVTNHWDGNASNESRGQDSRQEIFVTPPTVANDSECIACHDNSLGTTWTDYDYNLSLVRATARSNVSHYGINASGTPVVGPGLVVNSGQNCTYCHTQPNGAIRDLWLTNGSLKQWPTTNVSFVGNIRHETNVSLCTNCHGNLSSSNLLHSEELDKEISVHYAFDWEGDDAIDDEAQPPYPNREESCIACHNNMTFGGPPQYKICEDCHLPNGTGPFTGPVPSAGPAVLKFYLRSDLSGWNISDREALGIPIIYSHVPYNEIQNSTTSVFVSRNLSGETGEAGMSTRSSCFSWNPASPNGSCHGVGYSLRLAATPPEDLAQGKEYFMHYGEREYGAGGVGSDAFNVTFMNTYIQDYAPNTTDCFFCHNQSNVSVRQFWGNAVQIYYNRTNQSQYIGDSLMFGATTFSECFNCHTSDKVAPSTFHASTLVPAAGGPDCVACHDMGQPNTTIQINVTALTLGVHGLVNQNASNTTDLTIVNGVPASKACWACHESTGGQPADDTMGDRYRTPRNCWECHNGTAAFANVSNAPTVSQHFFGATDIKAGSNQPTIVTSCLGCHNKSEMIVYNNDTTFGTFADNDGDGVVGGNLSFYHYGKNRSAELRTQYNSSDCGAGTTICNLSGMAVDTNYTYTDCAWCHQNTTTSFASAMNYTGLGENSHENVSNHTDNSGGPFCLDCHYNASGSAQARIHDAGLYKPARSYNASLDGTGMYDSASVCRQCHTDKEVHADDATINTDSIECASCHANGSGYSSGYGEKQVHGVRFINDSGVYSAAGDRSAAANCTTCHQGSLITQLYNSTGAFIIPKIPLKFNHSNDASAGQLWNETDDGYNGPWNVNGAGDNLAACLYCHGNVNKSSTDENNITNIVHNTSALGRVSNAFTGANYVNGTINTTSAWCGACHYPLNSMYAATVGSFTADGWEVPPDNTNESSAGFFNHSATLSSDESDAKCAISGCHGGLLSSGLSSGMDEFSHNVMAGSLDACIACHDLATSVVPTALVNVSAFNRTDVDVGENIGKLSENRTLHGDINDDAISNDSDCKYCHYNTTGMGEGFTVKLLVSDSAANAGNVSMYNTYYCSVCHFVNTSYNDGTNEITNPSDYPYNVTDVGTPPEVLMHTPYSAYRNYSDVGTFTPTYTASLPAYFTGGRTPNCETCHNNSIVYFNASDSVLKRAAHYGKYTNLTTLGVSDENTTSCAQCHRGEDAPGGAGVTTTGAERLGWGVDDALGRSGGYLSSNDGNAGTGFDMFGTSTSSDRNYCYACHLVQNVEKTKSDSIDPPQVNFHFAEVTYFMWNCDSCH